MGAIKVIRSKAYLASKVRAMREKKLKEKRKNPSLTDFFYLLVLCFIILGVSKSIYSMFDQLNPVNSVEAQVETEEVTEPTPTPKPTPGSKWIAFKQAAQKVCPMYNFDCKVVISMGQLESAYGSSHYCVERNNCLGIGAVDWDPNQAFTFENQEQALIEYMRIIRKNFPTAWANRNNPDEMIKYIKYDPATKKMYASDENYIAKVKSMSSWWVK